MTIGVYTGRDLPRAQSYPRCGLILSVIEQLGYVGLLLVLFAASLGVPIPEELPIIAAGVLSNQAVLRWWLALPVCFVGVISGDVVLYWIGHHWGRKSSAGGPCAGS